MNWQPIETAPPSGYIVVGMQIAKGKWLFNYVFRENDEWVDVHNFRVKKYGADIHIDSHITLPFYLSLKESHDEVSHFEEIIRKNTHHNLEVFVHSDPCMPECCVYCRMKDCNKRTSEFKREIIWNAETLVTNQKHFDC